jgi:alkylhydroperoxidase family enzyme
MTGDRDAIRPAWIEVIPESEADGELAALYDELRSPQTGHVDHVMAIHSLHPQSMRDHQQLYRTLMYGAGGLTRPEREMIGVVVSALNRCHY